MAESEDLPGGFCDDGYRCTSWCRDILFYKEKEENLFPCCLKSNFFVEFTQNLLHTPANRFWRSLSLEEEKLFASSLKKYEGKTLLALCAEDKVFYDRLERKYKVKLDIFSLAQIINGNGKTK